MQQKPRHMIAHPEGNESCRFSFFGIELSDIFPYNFYNNVEMTKLF